jgi:hypothetical protein
MEALQVLDHLNQARQKANLDYQSHLQLDKEYAALRDYIRTADQDKRRLEILDKQEAKNNQPKEVEAKKEKK